MNPQKSTATAQITLPHDNTQVEPPDDLRVPLVIGVTGHRDLCEDAIPKLREQIAQIFTDLRTEFPNTPWILLSPLAEGADRLVVQVAKEHFNSQYRLVVPLPMPIGDYACSFDQGTESLTEFHELAAGAQQVKIWERRQSPTDFTDTADREVLYAAAGAYVVRHSQVLIALWDRERSDSPCGTACTVQYKQSGLPTIHRESGSPVGVEESGPVYVITTPRTSHKGALKERIKVGPYEILGPDLWTDHKGSDEWNLLTSSWKLDRDVSPLENRSRWYWLSHGIEVWEKFKQSWEGRKALASGTFPSITHGLPFGSTYRSSLQNMDAFNARAKAIPKYSPAMEKSKDYVLGKANSPRGIRHRALMTDKDEAVMQRYCAADSLAKESQANHRRSLILLCAFAVLATFSFDVYAHVNPHHTVLALFYPAVILAAAGAFIMVRKCRYQEDYLDYRAIAEGMRVTFFWEVLALDTSVSDNYLHQQRGELDWIRFTLRNWRLDVNCLFPNVKQENEPDQLFNLVRDCWIYDQAGYHSSSTRVRADLRKMYEFGVLGYVAAGWLLAVVIGLTPFHSPIRGTGEFAETLLRLEIIGVGLSVALAAVFAAYAEKRGIAAESRHFAHMVDLFMHVALQWDLLERAAKPGSSQAYAEIEKLVIAIGKEALQENALWVILHRERPIELIL